MKDKMLLELLHLMEKPEVVGGPPIGHLVDEHEASAQALRSQLREYGASRCASTPPFESDPLEVVHVWKVSTIGELHADQRRPIQARQADVAAQAALDRTMAELAAARREAKEEEVVDSGSSHSSSPSPTWAPTTPDDESDASTLGSARSHHDDQQGQQLDQNPQQQQQQQAAAAASSSSSRSCRRSSRR